MAEEKFLNSVKGLLTDKQLYTNAKQIKSLIDNENGLQNTADEIEKNHS